MGLGKEESYGQAGGFASDPTVKSNARFDPYRIFFISLSRPFQQSIGRWEQKG
jgi:hypothetical protein